MTTALLWRYSGTRPRDFEMRELPSNCKANNGKWMTKKTEVGVFGFSILDQPEIQLGIARIKSASWDGIATG